MGDGSTGPVHTSSSLNDQSSEANYRSSNVAEDQLGQSMHRATQTMDQLQQSFDQEM
ncbi:hypothetical protein [Sphingobacterium faecale]|uniref:Uncharacterized protein n=1 Tax=Sphingobacterium faecale TaxID=2803775 RepID=A0ABS1R8A4_9SPHI|nr:hypothetical protein [Sphingobacterium faecale]MBL1410960.1 hypothetical protein [Sphingobacterium faecale]